MEGCDYKLPQGNFWEELCGHYPDCGHNFTGVNIYQSYQILYIKYVWLNVCQLCFNKTVKKKLHRGQIKM